MVGEEQQTTILQHWVFSDFVLPFLLMFFIVFAVLEKTKILTEKKNINALVAFVIGLIFVGAAYQRGMVGNLIIFMTVALVVIFVVLMLIGFAVQKEPKLPEGKIKWVVLVAIIVVAIATIWAAGVQWSFFENMFNVLFDSSWSKSFWTNATFIIVIAVALAVVIGVGAKAKS